MVRVLLVEDSVVQREILRRILSMDDAFQIVGEARNGAEAVRMVDELRPDVVLMDIHMPNMNGVEATREIMRRFAVPIVIASATLKKHDIDMGLECLHAGAISVIAKPEGAVLLNLDKISVRLREELMAASKVKLRPFNLAPVNHHPVKRRKPAGTIEVIGICASTGGPTVLTEIFSLLPRPFAIPILLVQHITRGFEEQFVKWLSGHTGQPVGMIAHRQRLGPGIWMAPTGNHLTVAAANVVVLSEQRPGDIHCPSGDELFAALAKHFGPRAAGFLLSGMGNDGAAGLLELKRAGGVTVIQDEASSFIWGMPKVGQDMKAATHELNPREIAALLTDMHEMTMAT